MPKSDEEKRASSLIEFDCRSFRTSANLKYFSLFSASRSREFLETEIQRKTAEKETKAKLSTVLKQISKAELLALSAMKKN